MADVRELPDSAIVARDHLLRTICNGSRFWDIRT